MGNSVAVGLDVSDVNIFTRFKTETTETVVGSSLKKNTHGSNDTSPSVKFCCRCNSKYPFPQNGCFIQTYIKVWSISDNEDTKVGVCPDFKSFKQNKNAASGSLIPDISAASAPKIFSPDASYVILLIYGTCFECRYSPSQQPISTISQVPSAVALDPILLHTAKECQKFFLPKGYEFPATSLSMVSPLFNDVSSETSAPSVEFQCQLNYKILVFHGVVASAITQSEAMAAASEVAETLRSVHQSSKSIAFPSQNLKSESRTVSLKTYFKPLLKLAVPNPESIVFLSDKQTSPSSSIQKLYSTIPSSWHQNALVLHFCQFYMLPESHKDENPENQDFLEERTSLLEQAQQIAQAFIKSKKPLLNESHLFLRSAQTLNRKTLSPRAFRKAIAATSSNIAALAVSPRGVRSTGSFSLNSKQSISSKDVLRSEKKQSTLSATDYNPLKRLCCLESRHLYIDGPLSPYYSTCSHNERSEVVNNWSLVDKTTKVTPALSRSTITVSNPRLGLKPNSAEHTAQVVTNNTVSSRTDQKRKAQSPINGSLAMDECERVTSFTKLLNKFPATDVVQSSFNSRLEAVKTYEVKTDTGLRLSSKNPSPSKKITITPLKLPGEKPHQPRIMFKDVSLLQSSSSISDVYGRYSSCSSKDRLSIMTFPREDTITSNTTEEITNFTNEASHSFSTPRALNEFPKLPRKTRENLNRKHVQLIQSHCKKTIQKVSDTQDRSGRSFDEVAGIDCLRGEKETLLEKYRCICSEVVPGARLYISGAQIAQNYRILQQHGFTHIINMAGDTCNNYFPFRFRYLTFILQDNRLLTAEIQSILMNTLIYIADTLTSNDNNKILVHCREGVSRSATIILAYLMWITRLSFQNVLDILRTARPTCNPNTGFTYALLRFSKLLNYVPNPLFELPEDPPILAETSPSIHIQDLFLSKDQKQQRFEKPFINTVNKPFPQTSVLDLDVNFSSILFSPRDVLYSSLSYVKYSSLDTVLQRQLYRVCIHHPKAPFLVALTKSVYEPYQNSWAVSDVLLDPRFYFILRNNEQIFLWRGNDSLHRALTEYFFFSEFIRNLRIFEGQQYHGHNWQFYYVKQGQESQEFWHILYSKDSTNTRVQYLSCFDEDFRILKERPVCNFEEYIASLAREAATNSLKIASNTNIVSSTSNLSDKQDFPFQKNSRFSGIHVTPDRSDISSFKDVSRDQPICQSDHNEIFKSDLNEEKDSTSRVSSKISSFSRSGQGSMIRRRFTVQNGSLVFQDKSSRSGNQLHSIASVESSTSYYSLMDDSFAGNEPVGEQHSNRSSEATALSSSRTSSFLPSVQLNLTADKYVTTKPTVPPLRIPMPTLKLPARAVLEEPRVNKSVTDDPSSSSDGQCQRQKRLVIFFDSNNLMSSRESQMSSLLNSVRVEEREQVSSVCNSIEEPYPSDSQHETFMEQDDAASKSLNDDSKTLSSRSPIENYFSAAANNKPMKKKSRLAKSITDTSSTTKSLSPKPNSFSADVQEESFFLRTDDGPFCSQNKKTLESLKPECATEREQSVMKHSIQTSRDIMESSERQAALPTSKDEEFSWSTSSSRYASAFKQAAPIRTTAVVTTGLQSVTVKEGSVTLESHVPYLYRWPSFSQPLDDFDDTDLDSRLLCIIVEYGPNPLLQLLDSSKRSQLSEGQATAHGIIKLEPSRLVAAGFETSRRSEEGSLVSRNEKLPFNLDQDIIKPDVFRDSRKKCEYQKERRGKESNSFSYREQHYFDETKGLTAPKLTLLSHWSKKENLFEESYTHEIPEEKDYSKIRRSASATDIGTSDPLLFGQANDSTVEEMHVDCSDEFKIKNHHYFSDIETKEIEVLEHQLSVSERFKEKLFRCVDSVLRSDHTAFDNEAAKHLKENKDIITGYQEDSKLLKKSSGTVYSIPQIEEIEIVAEAAPTFIWIWKGKLWRKSVQFNPKETDEEIVQQFKLMHGILPGDDMPVMEFWEEEGSESHEFQKLLWLG